MSPADLKLSPSMIRALRYLYASEARNTQGNVSTATAIALRDRGLVDAHFSRVRGYDCDLTPRGREVAREL